MSFTKGLIHVFVLKQSWLIRLDAGHRNSLLEANAAKITDVCTRDDLDHVRTHGGRDRVLLRADHDHVRTLDRDLRHHHGHDLDADHGINPGQDHPRIIGQPRVARDTCHIHIQALEAQPPEKAKMLSQNYKI